MRKYTLHLRHVTHLSLGDVHHYHVEHERAQPHNHPVYELHSRTEASTDGTATAAFTLLSGRPTPATQAVFQNGRDEDAGSE